MTRSLRGGPRVTVVGDTTGGSTGQPYLMELGDGMRARVSARCCRLPDGSVFEGIGVAPDVFAAHSLSTVGTAADPVLDRALEVIRGAERAGTTRPTAGNHPRNGRPDDR